MNQLKDSTLAIDGGKPVRNKPWAPWPVFAEDEVNAVAAVLRSGRVNYWTGEEGRHFEAEYAAHTGRRHAIALANGTVALELALYALGIGPGDEVIVPARTFIASASCVVMRGARPVVADVDPISGNLTAETVAPLITPRTRTIIAVHLAGWPCDMEPLLVLARQRGIHIIEDCAQAHGASYKGRPVGSFGVAAAFSFCQDKILTTGGEGGMLVLDDEELWKRAWAFKDHGKGYDVVYHRQHPPGFRWLHESFGTNWRMTEMQAVIGRLQLQKLPEWLAARRANAALLAEGLSAIPGLSVPQPSADINHAYYKFYAYLQLDRLKEGWNQTRILEAINAEGVPCFAGSCSEIYREKAFIDAGWVPTERLPNAARLGETSLMFQVHPGLTDHDMRDVCRAVSKVMAKAVEKSCVSFFL
jgi:dTDP-4-amino-4,6-dideoxygalactose transaminase